MSRSYRMIDFCVCPIDEVPAAALVQAMRDDIAALYEGLELDGPDMPAAGPAELGPPHGLFLLGCEEGEALCCGGVSRRRLLR